MDDLRTKDELIAKVRDETYEGFKQAMGMFKSLGMMGDSAAARNIKKFYEAMGPLPKETEGEKDE